jgi:hypothetical protein
MPQKEFMVMVHNDTLVLKASEGIGNVRLIAQEKSIRMFYLFEI